MRVLACWLLLVGVAAGQVPAAAAVVLRGMAQQAGVIFAGRVLEVRRNDSAGYVDVVFAVDRAVRGCESAKPYLLREWAGLWAEEPRRYGVGQRLLMILAAPGPSGMSAPVGGMAGRIPLVGVRHPPIVNGMDVTPEDTGSEAEQGVDLRWVEAAARRSTAFGGRIRAEAATGAEPKWAGPVRPIQRKPVEVARAGLSAVLAVLGAN